MISLYRRAFAAVAQHWWYFLANALIVEIGIGFFPDSGWMVGVTLVIYVTVNYAIYRYHMLGVHPVLLDRPAPSDRPEKFISFAWATAVLIGLTIAVIVVLVIVVATWSTLQYYDLAFLENDEISSAGSEGSAAIITLISLLFYGLILAIFGTMLPASAIGDPFGLRLTLDRARRTFWPVTLRLIMGTGLLSALSLGAVFYLTTQIGMPTEMRDMDGAFSAVGLATGLALQMVGVIGTSLGAIVICDAYRSTLPTPPDEIAATFA
jgi:hypothetical protein